MEGIHMSDMVNWRIHPRLPVAYPAIFGGAPFVGEGVVSDLSVAGCAVTCTRTVLMGSYIKLSVILPDPSSSVFIELGRIRWVHGNAFGVEFIRVATLARHRLDQIVSHELSLEANFFPVPA
jgi:PilZ domain-containing protein